MNFLQLQNAVIDNTSRSDKLPVIKNAINFALLEIAKLHEWKALKVEGNSSVVINDLSVSLAADFYRITEMRLINPSATSLSYAMHIYPKLSFIKKWPNVSAYGSGRPYIGYLEGGSLFFYPRSSAAYTLRYTYTKLPAALVTDGDVNPFVECDLPVIQWATGYIFGSIQMFEAATQWMSFYAQSITQSMRAEKRDVGIESRIEQFSQDEDLQNTSPVPWNDPFVGH